MMRSIFHFFITLPPATNMLLRQRVKTHMTEGIDRGLPAVCMVVWDRVGDPVPHNIIPTPIFLPAAHSPASDWLGPSMLSSPGLQRSQRLFSFLHGIARPAWGWRR